MVLKGECEGITYVVGETAVENWNLLENASPKDIWIHADGIPSPHGWVHRPHPRTFIKEDWEKAIWMCARQVKEYSKARHQRRLRLSVLEGQFLRKGTEMGSVRLLKRPRIILV